MKIGVIGGGEAGQDIAAGLIELGHDVVLGGHQTDPDLKIWAKHIPEKKGKIGTTTEAASFGEIAVLAAPWHATEDILQQIRPELAGKIIIDITNPLVFEDDGPPSLSFGHDISGGEMVQQSLPDSHVVKTLNFISHRHMFNPKYKDGTPSMLLCGNNTSAKEFVTQLLDEMGWKDITDLGDIDKCRLLEPLCALWIEYGLVNDTWDHAISILKE